MIYACVFSLFVLDDFSLRMLFMLPYLDLSFVHGVVVDKGILHGLLLTRGVRLVLNLGLACKVLAINFTASYGNRMCSVYTQDRCVLRKKQMFAVFCT